MKKIYLVLLLASFFIGNAQINWKRCAASSNAPAWSGTGNTERGMGALNNKMYVVTRNVATKIKVINGVDGTDLPDVIDYTGVAGGTFTLCDVEVSTNGSILACNLTATSNTSAFKVYRWDSETATPTVYISFLNAGATADNLRLGDSFTVTGDITGDAVIFAGGQVAGTSGATSVHKVVRWIVTGGVLGTPTVITLGSLGLTSGNLIATPLTIDANPAFLINSNGRAIYKCNADGTLTTETITNVALSSNDTKYFEVGTKKYVASYIYGTGGEFVKLVDVTSGLATATTVSVTPTLGTVANGNGTGGLGVKVIPDLVDGINNTVTIYALSTNNGISGTTLVYNGITLGNTKFSALEAHNAAKIFPNPASNEFYIAIDTNLEKDAQAFIYDIQGRQVKSAKIDASIQTVSIQDLNAGEYLVKVINGKNNTTTKLLKN